MSERIDTEVAEIFRVTPDVVGLKFKTDQQVNLGHAVEIDEAVMTLIKDKRHFFLIDASDIISNMDNAASRYFSKEGAAVKYIKAAAIVLNSLPIRLTATFFIKFQKPEYPAKIFADREQAMKWFEKMRSRD